MIEPLQRPEYLHILINPLPVYGLLLGLPTLALALVFRSRAAQVTALALILFAAASAWPVSAAGHRAYNKVYLLTDNDGKAWLDSHMHRAEKVIYLFGVLAALALAAIVLPLKVPKLMLPLALITLLAGFAALGAGGWIARAGGKVRHPEFREPPHEPAAGHACASKNQRAMASLPLYLRQDSAKRVKARLPDKLLASENLRISDLEKSV